jgi:hypothetical protein
LKLIYFKGRQFSVVTFLCGFESRVTHVAKF